MENKTDNTCNIKIFQSADSLDIYLYDDIKPDSWDWWTDEPIKSETSSKTIKDLLEQNPNVAKINLYINSDGGSLKEGIGIYSLLKRHKAYKTAYVDGFAASIASVIPMACDKIVMSAVSLMFLHHASACIYANAKGLRKWADDLDVIDSASNTAYLEHAGEKLSAEKLTELLDAETWLNATQCLEYGLCDEIQTENIKNNQSVYEQLIKKKQNQQIEQTNKTVFQQMAEMFRSNK